MLLLLIITLKRGATTGLLLLVEEGSHHLVAGRLRAPMLFGAREFREPGFCVFQWVKLDGTCGCATPWAGGKLSFHASGFAIL